MYNVNYTEILKQGIKKADPNWPTIPCTNGWEYDRSVIPYESISTEVGFCHYRKASNLNPLTIEIYFTPNFIDRW